MNTLNGKLCAVLGGIVQLIFGCVLLLANGGIRSQFPGASTPLVTRLSLALLHVIPVVALLLIAIGFIMPALRRQLGRWSLTVVFVETMLLAFFLLAIVLTQPCNMSKLLP